MNTPEMGPVVENTRMLLTDQERISAIRTLVDAAGICPDERHSFMISPEPLRIPHLSVIELMRLGKPLKNFFIVLNELMAIRRLKIFPESVIDKINRGLADPLSEGEREMIKAFPVDIPLAFRVDAMINEGGQMFIAEIEGDKKHGFGFAALTKEMARVTSSETKTDQNLLPGVVPLLSDCVRRQGERLIIIISDKEKFYSQEQAFLARAVSHSGVPAEVVDQDQIGFENNQITISGRPQTRAVLFDIPEMKQQSRACWLKKLWLEGKIKCLIPPSPFLGIKGSFALAFDPETREFFRQTALDCEELISHFPETIFLMRGGQAAKTMVALQEAVLKRVRSSGTRGVAIGKDGLKETGLWQAAADNPEEFIIQEQIKQKTFAIRTLTEQGIVTQNRFVRLAAFFVVVNGTVRLADISATARLVPNVHGNPDAVLLPIGINV